MSLLLLSKGGARINKKVSCSHFKYSLCHSECIFNKFLLIVKLSKHFHPQCKILKSWTCFQTFWGSFKCWQNFHIISQSEHLKWLHFFIFLLLLARSSAAGKPPHRNFNRRDSLRCRAQSINEFSGDTVVCVCSSSPGYRMTHQRAQLWIQPQLSLFRPSTFQ